MSAEIIPFDFEEQAVRVVMRGEDPWFVAADVCRVLGILNTSDAVKRLDDDEVTLDQIEGSHRETNLVSESGLYALVIRSDKPAAKRFRKWITAEVLPSLRKHGRYEMPGLTEPARSFEEVTARDWLAMIREARILGGAPAGRRIWSMSPLPPLSNRPAGPDAEEGRACLRHLLADLAGAVAAARDGCSEVGEARLTREGLRATGYGLFVANFPLPVFAGTNWTGGRHKPALMAVPGAQVAGPLTLGGRVTRGVVLPWAQVDAASEGGQSDD